jgi:hypothetical protein
MSDTFQQTDPATSGPLTGFYLWSNVANWTPAKPTDGATADVGATGYDDIASLTLASLLLSSGGAVFVVANSLGVTTVTGTSGSELLADSVALGSAAAVTVGTIDGSGGTYGADGAGASFVDQSTTDAGETYLAENGGFVELAAAPSASSVLKFSGTGGTIALESPGASVAAPIEGLAIGDEIDLPSLAFAGTVTPTLENGNTLEVTEGSTTITLLLDPSGNYANVSFVLVPDGTGGTYVAEAVAPAGDVAGDWTTPSFWNTGALPTAGQDVLLSTGATIVNPASSADFENVGTVQSVTVPSELVMDNAGLTVTGAFVDKYQTLIDTGSFDGGEGGSQLTIGATLWVYGSLRIGNTAMLRPTTVTANGLFVLESIHGTGAINVLGSTTGKATLDIDAPAGSGTTGVLTGDFDIEGDALLEFASGQINTLSGLLLINGTDAFVADSSDTTHNSALTGLNTIGSNAELIFENGPTATLSGDLFNEGYIYLDNGGDGDVHAGGGDLLLTVAGTLSNDGAIYLGNAGLTAPDKLEAAALVNTDAIEVFGGSAAAEATIDITGSAYDDDGDFTIGQFAAVDIGGDYKEKGGTDFFDVLGSTAVPLAGVLAITGQLNFRYGTNFILDSSVSLSAGTALTLVTFAPGELLGMFGSFQGGDGNGTYINVGNNLTEGILYNDSLGTVVFEVVATPTSYTNLWAAGTTGSWNTAADWTDGSGGHVTPTFYTEATVGANAGITVNVDVTVYSLTLDSDAAVTLDGGYSLSIGYLLSIKTGASLTISGEATVLEQVTNEGSLTVASGGRLYDVGNYFGSNGATDIDPGGFLELNARDSLTITFTGTDATLALDEPTGGAGAQYGATALVGLGAGDVLELPGTKVESLTIGATSLMVTTDVGTYDLSNITWALEPTGYTAAVDTTTDLVAITFTGTLPCFVRGTRILTETGEVAVEALAEGDRVVLADGGSLPVIWIGHRRVDCARHPDPRLVWPVRISAGAFGAGMPHRDLFLSPDHAVYANGVLIPVKYLINDASIAQIRVDSVTYFHVELPRHEALLVEGLPAESYLDTGNRGDFANGGGSMRLHPDFASVIWDGRRCAELVITGPAFEAVRRQVDARAQCLAPAA